MIQQQWSRRAVRTTDGLWEGTPSASVCAQTRRMGYWMPLVTAQQSRHNDHVIDVVFALSRTILIGKIALSLAEPIETFPVQTIVTLKSRNFVRGLIYLPCHCNFLFQFKISSFEFFVPNVTS